MSGGWTEYPDPGATETTLLDVESTLASKLDVVTPDTFSFNTLGTHELIIPAAGNRLQLRWLWAQGAYGYTDEQVVTFKYGPTGGPYTDIYLVSLEASQPFAHAAVIDLPTDDVLAVTMTQNKLTYFNIDYREVA